MEKQPSSIWEVATEAGSSAQQEEDTEAAELLITLV